MSTPILATKLFIPPVRPNLVLRPQLIAQLNQGLQLGRKLTLVSAPAGFGKTTLLSEWLASLEEDKIRNPESQIPIRTAWLNLDDGDNALPRFLAYLIAALNPAAEEETAVGKGVLDMIQSPQALPAAAIMTALINDLSAFPGRIILTIDDYHVIDSAAVDEALAYLLEHQPPNLHLVIATRIDPPLPFARLRARDQLTEIRATGLRFSSAEAAEFLNRVMGLNLSTEDITALETRTEGWIAGLQLAAISMRGRKDTAALVKSFTGSNRYVLDYLIEEVLDQQPADIQDFLLHTALLKQLTGPLCDAVRFAETPNRTEGSTVRFAETPNRTEGSTVRFAETPNRTEGSTVRFAETPNRTEGSTVRFAETPTRTEGSATHESSAHSTEFANGQAILEMLEQANLFIMPLDEERRWYRYHHLFADLLRQRLCQTHPQLIPILHRRAGRWFAQNGFIDEAIDEALLAGDFAQAAQLIARVAEGTWKRGDDSKLRRWLERLPADQVYSKPQFCVYLAWCLLADGELDEAQKALQAAGRALEKMAQAENQPAGQNLQTIQGKIAAAHAFAAFYRGEFADLFHYAGQALDYLPQHDLAWRSTATHLLGDAYDFQGDMLRAYQSRVEAVEVSKTSGNSYVSMIANLKLAIILRRQGKLHEALEICRQQMALATESRMAQTVLVGWLFAIWGEVLAESNDLEGARRKAKMSAERLEHDGDLAMIGSSYLGLIRIMFSCDDLPAAEEFIHKIERLDHGSDVPPWISSLAASWQARIWLAQGKQDLALRWAAERPLDAAEELTYVRETECVDIARLLIAQGRLAEANGLLERLLGPARSYGRTWHVIEILMLQALAHQAAGDTDRALAALEQALVTAEPGGITRTFIDEGPPMASLLHAANARGIMPAYVEKLLQAFSAPPQQAAISQTTSDIGHPTPGIIDSLSDRELEVLQLIAQGLTNSQIAARLYLSLNTVKAHTRSIYSKLDVHNRTQAVARARALHLLPP